jgi:hypothetical protein
MEIIEIIAQILGIFGMVFMISSYQVKSQRGLILVQLFGAAFFFLNFLLLGIASGMVLAGMVLNFIGILRCIVFSNKEKFHADNKAWLIGFVASYFVAYVLIFTVLGVETTVENMIIELLPVIGMTSSNIAFFKNDAKSVRLLGFITSPSWLVYDVFRFSIGGILTEALSLVSIIIGLIRYDIKRKEKTE